MACKFFFSSEGITEYMTEEKKSKVLFENPRRHLDSGVEIVFQATVKLLDHNALQLLLGKMFIGTNL